MRIKSRQTTISYASRKLIEPGGYFDGDAISDSLETTARGVELVNSQFVKLEHTKNNRASRDFSFSYDFKNVESALQYKFDAESHASEKPTGTLTIAVGDMIKTCEAGLTSLTSSISIMPASIRLTLSYSFVTGRFI